MQDHSKKLRRDDRPLHETLSPGQEIRLLDFDLDSLASSSPWLQSVREGLKVCGECDGRGRLGRALSGLPGVRAVLLRWRREQGGPDTEGLGADMKTHRPLIVVGTDPGKTSGYGIHCEDLKRDFARGYVVPHDWHWGQCKGVNGRDIQTEFSSILDLIAAYYAAEWTTGDESSGEPMMVMRGTGKGEQWFACPEFHFYVESQFIIDDRKVEKKVRVAKQNATLKTATSKGRWMAIAETFGFQTHQVHPTVWREAQLGKGWGSVPREKAKAQAVALANQLWGLGLKASQDHGAEALFITEYGWIEQMQVRRMARAGR